MVLEHPRMVDLSGENRPLVGIALMVMPFLPPSAYRMYRHRPLDTA
jgi:hypothetical protein